MKRIMTSLLLMALLGIACQQARAQNQTPANVASAGWTDPDTGLTWTKSDNGAYVNWNQANTYCTNLRLGGYTDWRLPTIDELQGIYDPGIDIPGHASDGSEVTWHVKGNLKLSGLEWSSTQNNAGEVWNFYFDGGARYTAQGFHSNTRTLCVRR